MMDQSSSDVLGRMTADEKAYWDQYGVGSTFDVAGGALTRVGENQATFKSQDGKDYSLNRGQDFAKTASEIPDFAKAWEQNYGYKAPEVQAQSSVVSPLNTQGVQTSSALISNDTSNAPLSSIAVSPPVQHMVQRDYNDYFAKAKVGEYTDFAGGTFYKFSPTKSVFMLPDGREYTLTDQTDLDAIAYTIPEIANEWKTQYGFTPTGDAPASGVMTADNWNPIRQVYAAADRDPYATDREMIFDKQLRAVDLSKYRNNPHGAFEKLAMDVYGGKGMTLEDISRLQDAVGAIGMYTNDPENPGKYKLTYANDISKSPYSIKNTPSQGYTFDQRVALERGAEGMANAEALRLAPPVAPASPAAPAAPLSSLPAAPAAPPPAVLTNTAPEVIAEVDPYIYAYDYGVANNDFSGLLSLLQKTPDSTQLISKYNWTPEQINQIEFGTGFDIDQSGGYGAGKTTNDWNYDTYLNKLRAGDRQSINEGIDLLASQDPMMANNARRMFNELVEQQKFTGDSWATGSLGSKEAAAMDFALRLAENGVQSIYDLEKRTEENTRDEVEGGSSVYFQDKYINKKTGEALPDWARVAEGTQSGTKLNYQLSFAEDGTPIPYTTANQSDWMEFREGFLKPAISIIAIANPALMPYVAAGNALNAASKGDWGSAIVSGLTAAAGFGGSLGFTDATMATLNQAKTAAQVLNAIDKGNPIALATALMQTDTGKELMGQDMGGGIKMGDLVNTAKVAQLVNTGNYAEALSTVGQMTDSPNLKLAASAVRVQQAFESGDPFKIISAVGGLDRAVKSADAAAKIDDTGGITNRVVDDTISQGNASNVLENDDGLDATGSAAFIAAKNAGATDAEALDAANTVTGAATGVQVNKIPDAESGNAVITNYTRTPAAEAGVQRTRLNQDYAASLGKTVDTLSKEESENFNDKIEAAIGQGGYAVLKGASAQDILSGNYSALPTDEKGFTYDERGIPRVEVVGYNKLDSAGNVINMEPTEKGSKVATNVANAIVENITGIEGTTGKIVQQGLSTLLGLVGEQVADLSTSFGNMGLISRDNAGVTAGKYLEDIGKRLQLPETKQALDNWVAGVEQEETYFGKIASGVKGVFENPLVLTEVVKEIGQEILPAAIGLKVAKYAGLAAGVASSTFLNALESAGSTGRQSYDEEIAKNTPPAEAAKIADRKAGYAGIITMATSGIVDASIAKKYGAAIEDYLGRKASSTGGEFVQEGLEEGLIALATGKSPAEALTQSVVGSLVGAKTSGTIQTAADVQADLASSFASQGLKSTDGSFRAETIVPVGAAGALDAGSSVVTSTAPADAAITQAVQSGDLAAVNSAINGSIATAAESGADVDLSIASTLSSAVNAGADVNAVIEAATEAAANSGNNVSITSDAGVVTISNATTNTNTAVDTTTGITTSVNENTNTTTVVDANTNKTTVIDENTNTVTQTTTNPDTNIQTIVTTDTNTNTQTTINVNTDTGKVIYDRETTIPSDWKPPVVNPPVAPPATKPPAVTASTTPAAPALAAPKVTPKPSDGAMAGAGMIGLPLGINVDPASLRSKVTEGAIDPLARVKQAQAELERDVMMNQIDPRLLAVMQQRANPQQQTNQFEDDIGALAKLLRGEPEAPANQGQYYSYGSEDSIDDILGGQAANYKEGGFVEPLKASGGMVLPLLAKSGGALGNYKGREDFKNGKHVAGEGDGQSDDIPAWLADGEFVFPADVVSALGNGSTKAGTDKLYEMMHGIRDRARSKGPKDLPPPALKSPLNYLKSSKRSTS
jgi:hypothetical protein